MTTDLVQFLRDRLDEDEQAAQQSVQQAIVNLAGAEPSLVSVWRVVERPATGTFVATSDQWDRIAEVVPTYGGAHADHIARHDPARVLREVEAKRRILDDVLPTMQADELRIAGEWGVSADPVRETSDDLLSLLALPYADHPDFRPEWAPDQA